MLTDSQRDIIKATVPLLETGGEALTKHFYTILLADHPELRLLFNQAHQASGAQPRALANGVLMYARNIDRLQALGPLATQIVNKHVSLQIQPEHYPLVGACLIQAIREVLGKALATDAVIEAWVAAYQQLADMLIAAEAQVYDTLAAAVGGWRGARTFRVRSKVQESAEITSFYLAPVDGSVVMAFLPGQYIGLKLKVNGTEIRRNYSLSAVSNGREYRISVKREPGGVASNFLHDHLNEGETFELFPPAGHFTLVENERPLVLISGGVGITPTLTMAEAALAGSHRQVIFIHYARNAQAHAFAEIIQTWATRFAHFSSYVVYDGADPLDPRQPNAIGRPTCAQLRAWLPEHADVDAYFLGPTPFMAVVKHALYKLGVPPGQIRYEFFGPAQALQ
jgi:nitric oxide dioxygenase